MSIFYLLNQIASVQSEYTQLQLTNPQSTDTFYASYCPNNYGGPCDASRAIMNIADMSVTDLLWNRI